MAKLKLEYLWLDGYTWSPTSAVRPKSKKVIQHLLPRDYPMWGFDGSSTQQADGSSSDCMLKPIAISRTAPAPTVLS